MEDLYDWLSVKELSKLTGIKVKRLYTMIRQGVFETAYKAGRVWFIKANDPGIYPDMRVKHLLHYMDFIAEGPMLGPKKEFTELLKEVHGEVLAIATGLQDALKLASGVIRHVYDNQNIRQIISTNFDAYRLITGTHLPIYNDVLSQVYKPDDGNKPGVAEHKR